MEGSLQAMPAWASQLASAVGAASGEAWITGPLASSHACNLYVGCQQVGGSDIGAVNKLSSVSASDVPASLHMPCNQALRHPEYCHRQNKSNRTLIQKGFIS